MLRSILFAVVFSSNFMKKNLLQKFPFALFNFLVKA